MQLIGTHQVFRLLSDHSVFWRKQFRAHRGIQHIQEGGRKLRVSTGVGIIPDQMADQGFGHSGVNTVHGHVISVIGGPAKSQFRHIACSNYQASGLIRQIHQHLRSLSCLGIFISHIMNFRIVSDIPEMSRDRFPDIHLPECAAQLSHQLAGIPVGPVRGSETGHRHTQNAFPGQSQTVKSPDRHQKRQSGIQSP